jgi:translation initiation factor 1
VMVKNSKDEDFDVFGREGAIEEALREEQKITIRLEMRKWNKPMTIIEGIEEKGESMENLAKKLKSRCACGGTVKDGKIFLQGDQRYKAEEYLKTNGFERSSIMII